MKRAIVKLDEGEYVNVEADYMDADEKYVSIHSGDKLVGIFQMEKIKCIYLSEERKEEKR